MEAVQLGLRKAKLETFTGPGMSILPPGNFDEVFVFGVSVFCLLSFARSEQADVRFGVYEFDVQFLGLKFRSSQFGC